MVSEEKKDKKMIEYEKDTGKNAIWRGVLTESYKKWLEGEKVYNRKKERIAFYVDEELKSEWQDFIEENDFQTFSNLIRYAVDFFIQIYPSFPSIESLLDFSHDLKEPLTYIKGITHLLGESLKSQISGAHLSRLIDVQEKCKELQEKITQHLEIRDTSQKIQFDVLILDDDESTIKVLETYFEFKGISVRNIDNSSKIADDIKNYTPKVVLLDVILPEITGYELCKTIKNHPNPIVNQTPVYFITAIPNYEVEKKMKETNADGVFLKPFDFNQFDNYFKNF